jgi:hypothetical protein
MYPCDGCYDVQTVCELFLGDALRRIPGTTGIISLKLDSSVDDNLV